MRANSFLYYSCLATLLPCVASAGIRVGNLSRSNAQGYQQVNEMRYNASAANAAATADTAPVELPVVVENATLAQQILSGDSTAPVDMTQLEKCSEIYPSGEFAWARPTVGAGVGGAATCTAVVELRQLGAGENGGDLVIARANMAAGTAINCNISEFPAATLVPTTGEIVVPADSEPTIDDVIAVMNQEQKQNAGLKIAAGTVLFGIGGNIVAKNDPGKDSLLGGGKDKTTGTIVGALGGAALMAGNTYGGKVAGDMILSAGVNAAAGAVVGNIAASGDSVIRIEDCDINGSTQKCLWGYIEDTREISTNGTAYVNKTNIADFRVCEPSKENTGRVNCRAEQLTNAVVPGYTATDKVTRKSDKRAMELSDMFAEEFARVPDSNLYCFVRGEMTAGASCSDGTQYIKLDSARIVSKRTPAMIVGVQDKAFGWKKSDWSDLQARYKTGYEIVGRGGNGVVQNLNLGTDANNKPIVAKIENFTPVYVDADDGGVIDMDNKARLKGTLTGAGAGGALGAFTAYQGAQTDIENRWATAVREYKDSLQKFYCATGQRFLSYYNDVVVLPGMPTE